jgi:hypothetical protein
MTENNTPDTNASATNDIHVNPGNDGSAGGPALGNVSRRLHERQAWGSQLQITWMADGKPSSARSLKAYDLSRGGVGLVSKSPVVPGTIGVALLARGTGEYMIRCLEVRHCNYVGNSQHVVGACWIPTPERLKASVDASDSDNPAIVFMNLRGE